MADPIDRDRENEIVNEATASVMRRLTEGGKPVEAVVVVVLFKEDGVTNVSTLIDSHPESEEEADQTEGGFLLAASDILDEYAHERGLCAECNERKKAVH